MTSCRRIWRYRPPEELGFRARWWLPEAGPHLDPLEWSGPLDPVSQFPLPTAVAPDFDLITNAANINDAAGLGPARYGIIDGWVWLPDNVTHWRDNNLNTGERGMVLAGGCCGGSLKEQPGGDHDNNTAAIDATLMDPTPITGGWHYVFNPQSDLGSFQGLDLDYSTDDGVTWLPALRRQPTKPEIEGFDIPCCQELTEEGIAAGWSLDPLKECCQPIYNPVAEGTGETDVAAVKQIALTCIQDNQTPVPFTTQLPTPDQDGAFKRQGWAGDSGLILHHNHSHAISRLANPGDPVVSVAGAGITLAAQLILDRESTEEWYAYKFRVQVNRTAGAGWHRILIPQIAGFQQRMIYGIGNYRNASTTPQIDEPGGQGGDGAAPRGPYMGKEWHEWSSTGQLYGGIFRRDNDIGNEFVEFWVKYICS